MRAKVGLLLIAVHAWDRFSLLYLLEGPSKMHEAMCVITLTHQAPLPSWPRDLLIDPPATNSQLPQHLSPKYKYKKAYKSLGQLSLRSRHRSRLVQCSRMTWQKPLPFPIIHACLMQACTERANWLLSWAFGFLAPVWLWELAFNTGKYCLLTCMAHRLAVPASSAVRVCNPSNK